MNKVFGDIALMTEDVPRLARFYETLLQAKGDGDEVHTFILTEGAGLAIYSKRAAESDMGFDFAGHWGAGSMVLGFNVEDVDLEYERIKGLPVEVEILFPPRTHPWGARSMHIRDPDGHIVCFRSRVK